MLKSLRLKDFAIFKDITVQFSEHLCIISGETGAGKSIMVDGMLMLLGTRTDPGVVRDGASEAVVEGLFEIKDKSPVAVFLQEHGFEFHDELVIKRIINAQGKSRVYINGSPSTLSMLSELTKLLVDIHGQHEHQSLLDEENHIKLLDAYAGTEKSAEHVKTAYAELLKTIDQYNRLQSNSVNLKKEEELLKFQLSEIRAANLKLEEEAGLEKEYNILSNAQRMISDLNTVYETIAGDENGVIANIHRSLKLITRLQDIDPYLKGYAERLEAVSVELKDISSDLSSYVSRIDMDPQKLEQTEQRIELIEKLKKKYGKTIKDIIEYAVTIEKQIGKLNNTDEEIVNLQQKRMQLEKGLYRDAEELSSARKRAAAGLGKTVVQELKTLGMKDAVFEVKIEPPGKKDTVAIQGKDISSDGLDSVRFYFSANLGFLARPLTDIISGGELSRTMLAIKRALVKASPVPVLVFDEIDAGIGGTTAEIVGRKLKELSGYHQVICITHLPQIAGFGDYHISVSKHTSSGKTDVSVQVLDEKGRTEEIARMLSGETVSEIARKQAKEFLKYAKERT
jgi:DNA repair protein RecN (Recombination protein N)